MSKGPDYPFIKDSSELTRVRELEEGLHSIEMIQVIPLFAHPRVLFHL